MNETTTMQQQITVVGRETSISGQMSMTGSARILGQFEGRIAVEGDVFVAEGAIVRADILADQIVIEGEVEGNVTARERLQLASTAQLVGDIATRALVVEDGASLLGNCHVGADAAGQASGQASGQGGVQAVGASPVAASAAAVKATAGVGVGGGGAGAARAAVKPTVSVASIGMGAGSGAGVKKPMGAGLDGEELAAFGERAAG